MRILILGAPGSGKTTLAQALSSSLGPRCASLDELNFDRCGGGVQVAPYDDRMRRAHALADGDDWICEGNYLGWIAPLLLRADLIIYLGASLFLALRRVLMRHTVLTIRRTNPYPGWSRLARFCYYITMQHYDRLEPYTAQDVRVGPASTNRELEPYTCKVLRLSAREPTEQQVLAVRDRLRASGQLR